ncbi:MAG: hypothetical protein WCC92_06085 [Candidatus Korobacteraceae bacterium]
MERELLCTVRSGGKTTTAKALLETSEIVVRGDLRLKIPFALLKSVAARDGELHLKWPEGSVVFEIGDHAEKWAHKILHPKTTMEKLGAKPGMVISAQGMDDGNFVKDLRASAKLFSDAKALNNSDLVFFGAKKTAELARTGKLAASLAPAGALWIVYPKGKQEITELQVIEAGRQAGLVDVKGGQLFSNAHGAEVRQAQGPTVIQRSSFESA